ncbi:ATP-binding protein [hydrothermal vent metagenome]|uniref:ATP-binding protein n=1 Tax=hydrothermal vent metagenome TaxID=652676 RepID=A0A3B0WFT4_9ZZZZ
MTNKTKIERTLESKAKKGELLPTFQLFQNYSLGQDVDVNEDLALEYFGKCFRYLQNDNDSKPENRFILEKLDLVNFRQFDHLKIKLESDITVLIGDNGCGKTTIMEAISKTLSWICANLKKEGANGQRINDSLDIKNDAKESFTDIISSFSFGDGVKHLSATLSKAKVGAEKKRDNDIKNLKALADVWRVINAQRIINLPLMAFYSVERSHPIKNAKKYNKEASLLRDNRFDAYTDSLKGAGKFEHFITWYIRLHKKSNFKNAELLNREVEELSQSVKQGMNALEPLLIEKQQQLESLSKNNKVHSEKNNFDDVKVIDIIDNVICQVVPSISKIWVESTSGDDLIMLRNDEVKVRLKQLSEGQRIFMSLVADLARRLILLNPTLDNPLAGQGIVLIDEIELHLHPKWQQNILINLRRAFPNIQFIVTTHSPQVLSTVDKRSIRTFVLDENGKIQAEAPLFQTKGVKSSDILAEIMNTHSTPDVKEATDVEEFSKLLLVDSKKEDAESLLNGTLIPHFGESHPVILECKNQLKIYEMKLRIKASKNGK